MRKIVTALFVTSSIASAALISGTVVDSKGTPIAQAKVAYNSETTLTNESGTFSINQSTGIRHQQSIATQEFSYQNGKINVSLPTASAVQFRIFSVTGRQLCNIGSTLSAGTHSLVLEGTENLGTGVYFFESTIGSQKQVIKFFAESGVQWKSSYSSRYTPISVSSIPRATDQLNIFKSGFYDLSLSISTNTDTAIGTIVLDSVGFGMKTVTGGSFVFGDETGLGGSDELPVRTIPVTKFEMDSIEVTIGEFERLRGFVPPTVLGTNNRYPVTGITWFDAVLYANDRSKKADLDTVYSYKSALLDGGQCSMISGLTVSPNKNGYRLPTEQEWEFAAKAGSTTLWNSGNDASALGKLGWYDKNSGSIIHSGAQKTAASGIFDLYGNVAEWIGDWYGIYSESNSFSGPASGTVRVVRGGSFADIAMNCRSSVRNSAKPDSLTSTIGFRLVRSLQKSNHAPEISGNSIVSLDEDGSLELTSAMLTISDPDGETVFTLNVGEGSNYTVTGNMITPSPNFHGELTVPVTIQDSLQLSSNSYSLKVTVNPINDLPTIITPLADMGSEMGTSTSSSFIVSDIDGDLLPVTFNSKCASHVNSQFTYDAALGTTIAGVDTVIATITDGKVTLYDTALVTIGTNVWDQVYSYSDTFDVAPIDSNHFYLGKYVSSDYQMSKMEISTTDGDLLSSTDLFNIVSTRLTGSVVTAYRFQSLKMVAGKVYFSRQLIGANNGDLNWFRYSDISSKFILDTTFSHGVQDRIAVIRNDYATFASYLISGGGVVAPTPVLYDPYMGKAVTPNGFTSGDIASAYDGVNVFATSTNALFHKVGAIGTWHNAISKTYTRVVFGSLEGDTVYLIDANGKIEVSSNGLSTTGISTRPVDFMFGEKVVDIAMMSGTSGWALTETGGLYYTNDSFNHAYLESGLSDKVMKVRITEDRKTVFVVMKNNTLYRY